MQTRQHLFLNSVWDDAPSGLNAGKCQLVLAFGSSESIVKPEVFQYLKASYPQADIVFSSTAGEIMNDSVYDHSVAATAVELEKNKVRCVKTNINQHNNSFEAGNFLMKQLAQDDLRCIFIISDGTFVNGSELVNGFNEANHLNVPVTGGLAGDADRFEKTFTGLNEIPSQGNVIAVGFYGSGLLVGHGSFGGWDEFGHERTITRSDKNVLYEIDHKNALDLYKQYLGDYVNELPGSALLFPLSIKINGSEENLVRTILSVNEEAKSMTFAGNLPEGSKVRLMKANFDKLIDASSIAATNSYSSIGSQHHEPDLAILVSCVGRKLILQERTDEEVIAAREVLGSKVTITGFYSYGEISPFSAESKCELHNQTMTITTLTEI
ncbi:FIST signal transduction protein [Mucilaginibacter paludis]|uniref:FIST C domain-containing protein n=1 Tax=Mucilaginibacter paludis DSM 18603 TaxID=714943 RepID=H1YJ18_9SPHI|nr:FIST N-terminal domain-containing protein [Mucilaginibacter paludis]EHQ27713.1 FIST C domain-containing protein [Mucilaginibacter paludis DSM 18603]